MPVETSGVLALSCFGAGGCVSRLLVRVMVLHWMVILCPVWGLGLSTYSIGQGGV